MSTGKGTEESAEAERERVMRAIMMADLGSSRRDMCTTADTSKQARTSVQRLESQRQINVQGSIAQRQSEIDKASLTGWQTLHERIGDTGQMEALPDIASGQSHRAALHAAMRALEGELPPPGRHGNPSHPIPSAGRGSPPIRARGRGSPLPPNRNSSIGGVTKPGRPGPPRRSATVSFGLDPALNINNDPNDDDSFARGRGHKVSRGRGRAIVSRSPRLPPKPQRPMVDFAQKIADPSNFMSAYKKSFDAPVVRLPASGPTQPKEHPESPANAPTQPKSHSNHPSNAPKQPNSRSEPLAPLTSPNFNEKKITITKIADEPARVVPREDTAQLIKAKSDKTVVDKLVVGTIGSYTVEVPTPPPRKILPARKPKVKAAPLPGPSPTKTFQPPDIDPPKMEIAWKVPAGEHPRKKEASIFGPTTPVAAKKKTGVVAHEFEPKEDKRPLPSIHHNNSKAVPKVAPKEEKNEHNQVWTGSLLDTENSPIPGMASDILVPAPSPAIVDLDGVDFSSDKSSKAVGPAGEKSQLEILEARIQQLESIMSRAGGPGYSTQFRFDDWLNQADPNEAAPVQQAIRHASFKDYRSTSPPLSESSLDATPNKMSKRPIPTINAGGNDKDEFADRFTGRFSDLLISKSRSTNLLEVVSPQKEISTTAKIVTSSEPPPAPAKVIFVPVNVISQSRFAINKPQTLKDSIYASKENRADVPSETTRPMTDESVPRVKVIGVQPYNPARRK